MWLDRLAGHPTAPSTTLGPARLQNANHLSSTPNFKSPRTSSLSIHSDESTNSLVASRKISSSSFKESVATSNELEFLQELQKKLALPKHELSENTLVEYFEDIAHDDLRYEIDFQGMSLQEVANEKSSITEKEITTLGPIANYDKERTNFEELHEAIRSWDEALSLVESNLIAFRDNLAQVSAEIETIQARSTTLNISLDNRKNAKLTLSPIVEEISLPPSTIRKIVEGSIDDAWIKALAEIEKKLKILDSKAKESRKIKGITSLKPLLEGLICKALERIRDFLTSQIKVLRLPNTNAQIIQQQQFIRFKDMYTFLHKHHSQLAEEIGQAYVNTMRWYYLHQFTRYEKSLAKVKIHLIDKHDILGQDDGTRKSTVVSTSKSSGPLHDAFNLGRRTDFLKASNQTAISSFLAEEDRSTHNIEYPFRNLNLALMDNASAEYSFLTAFFTPALSYTSITRYFNNIFEPTFSVGQNFTKSLVSNTLDCLGLLICVRLNQNYAFELQRRKVPALEGYINATSMLLWPRFQIIMDAHCDSIRALTSSLSQRKLSASEATKQSTAPHFMIQRFGQFLQSILQLSAEASDDEPVSSSLGRLRGEIEAFLNKFGIAMEKRKRDRFIFNNYSLILTIIGEAKGKLADEQRAHFEEVKGVFGSGVP